MSDNQEMPLTQQFKRDVVRADMILSAAIVLVCAMVLGLLLVLGASARIHNQSEAERNRIRDGRSEGISFAQAYGDAVAAQRNYLLTHEHTRIVEFETARAGARLQVGAMRRTNADDPEVLTLVGRIATLSEQGFSALQQSVSAPSRPFATGDSDTELRTVTNAYHATLLQRAAAIRVREEDTRSRLDTIGVSLAILSFVTSGLAILALRREREAWRAANAALIEARAKAEASDLAKTRFLAAASHDMRQPLHALSLYISALQRRVENTEARDILGKMERAAASMSGMFSTLLDLARIQADVTPEKTVFPLHDVIDRVVSEHPSARIAASPTNLDVKTDPLLLERLLRNLVSNAMKHGGGEVRIAVAQEGAVAAISVSDNGPGIKLEDQKRVFDEFVRLDGRAGGEGLGLGLSIVRRIAQLLDLQLELHSAPGEGATFVVRVPAQNASPPAATTHVETPKTAMNGLKVLTMDDDPLALEASAGALRDLGAEVRTCLRESDVNAALSGGFRPELLVMDLRIDGALAGVEIADRACARFSPPPRVIMVTGDTAPETLSALRASGHQWLIKPVSARDLADAVEAARADA